MASAFQDFIQMLVRKLRGEDQEEELLIDYVSDGGVGGGGVGCWVAPGSCIAAVVLRPGDQRCEQHDGENAQPVLHQRQV